MEREESQTWLIEGLSEHFSSFLESVTNENPRKHQFHNEVGQTGNNN